MTNPTPHDFEALLAFHKSVFGDARMEVEEETTSTEETPATEDPASEEQETPTEEEETSEEEPEQPKTYDEEYVKGLRQEAANYRTRLREAEQKLSEAKTPEEYQAAVQELAEKNAALERAVMVSTVAREFDLPSELAELLKGDTEDDLKKHAKVLQKFAPGKEPKRLGGGLSPAESEDGFDPVAEYRKAKASRY